MTHFGWNFLLVGVFRRSPSQNRFEKANRVSLHFSEIDKKSLQENQKFVCFSILSNVKVTFL